jgi:hypothetical protein
MQQTVLISVMAGFLLVGAAAAQTPAGPNQLFVLADRCMACHNGLVTPHGADVSIGSNWRSSMMAHAARDPYWQAAVRREVLDHPAAQSAIEDECATCHMPMAEASARAAGEKGRVFSHLPAATAFTPMAQLAVAGVSCTMCHQITGEGLGERESFVGGFVVDTAAPLGERQSFGPYDVDQGRRTLMQSASLFVPAKADHIQSSELCATCHTLFTHTLGPDGEVIGELPEQVPYLEWRHSAYHGVRSCQSCHMPVVDADMPITGVLGQDRSGFSRHVFRGGNFLMPRIFNRFADELLPQALPGELDTAARNTVEHLQTSAATISIEGIEPGDGSLRFEVALDNLAGHKLPTAYPSRRAWVSLVVTDRAGATVFSSGALRPDGSIAGNDNDLDPARYEPHYAEISSADEVQVYEAIMEDPEGKVTTGLLSAVRFVKDNRLLPEGFDKQSADDDIAVRGGARDDGDFAGGNDRVRYKVALGDAEGPYRIRAELWYQPIAYRWARNLAGYEADEPQRFVTYFDSMAPVSATVLARAEALAD